MPLPEKVDAARVGSVVQRRRPPNLGVDLSVVQRQPVQRLALGVEIDPGDGVRVDSPPR
jgi:hypothetical protein